MNFIIRSLLFKGDKIDKIQGLFVYWVVSMLIVFGVIITLSL
jgi:hypothetical protein